MNALNNLKNKLFNKSKTEDELLMSCVEVMEIVGGYEAFKKLPLPAFFKIIEGINIKNKLEEKAMKKRRNK